MIRSNTLAVLALVLGFGLFGCSSSSSSSSPADGGGVFGDAGAGGDAGCSGEKPTCPEPCDAGLATPECLDGAWVCPPEPAIACIVSEVDAGFTCGTKTCDSATSYCLNGNGGAQPIDGGSSSTYTCEPLNCDGGAVSCACVSSGGCSCTDDTGAITVVCDYP